MNLAEALHTAQTTHRQGDLTQAKLQYLAIIKQHDNNDANYGLATLYFQQQQYSQAIPLFENLQTREPHATDIALNFALCLQAAGKTKATLTIINDILAHIPNDIMLVLSFARISFSLAEYPLTIKLLTLFSLASPELTSLLASAYFQSQQWAKAQQIYLKLVALDPKNPIFWQKLALCSAKKRDYKQAITAFATFIELSVEDSNHHLKFTDLYLLAKNLKQARKQLDISIKLNDNSVVRYELEAKINRLENNYPQAITAANKTITFDSKNALAWQIKAELNKETASCIANLTYLQTTEIEYSFQNQQNLYTLAKAYESEANYSQAFNCFNKANSIQKEQLAAQGLSFDPLKLRNEYKEFTKVLVKPITGSKAIETARPIKTVKPDNIFIVGMPRSGTTLVDRLLTQHPMVMSSGENEALAFTIEHQIKHQIKHQQALSKANWPVFFNNHADKFSENYLKSTALNADIIVDKMPHNFRYVGTILAIFNGAKIIQIRRSPQDLALSLFSHAFALEHSYATDLSAIAHAIFQANKLMDFWREAFPEQVLDVSYEELAQYPEQTAANLFNFCQLQWQQDYLNFFQQSVSSFTFSELQVRQAINTKKINFSANYQQQLSEFNDTYNALISAEISRE